jgi:hypothetical protein
MEKREEKPKPIYRSTKLPFSMVLLGYMLQPVGLSKTFLEKFLSSMLSDQSTKKSFIEKLSSTPATNIFAHVPSCQKHCGIPNRRCDCYAKLANDFLKTNPCSVRTIEVMSRYNKEQFSEARTSKIFLSDNRKAQMELLNEMLLYFIESMKSSYIQVAEVTDEDLLRVTSWFKLLYGGYGSVGYGSINSDPNFFNS